MKLIPLFLMLKLIQLSGLPAGAATITRSVPPECVVQPQFADEVIPSDDVEGDYWTNLLDDHTVLFSGQAGVIGRFQAYDLEKKVPIRLTKGLDPFPAPDGRRIYIHPSPIRFFQFDRIRAKIETQNEDGKELANMDVSNAIAVEGSTLLQSGSFADGPAAMENDPSVNAYYESMAGLGRHESASENYSDYRILTGDKEGAIKDYRVTFGKNDKILKVETLTPKGIPLCPALRKSKEVDLDFDTPIISPVGNEFAVVDRKTRSTVILSFDANTGECKKEFDFGFETGKVHFSPDGSKIAFHATGVKDQNKVLSYSKLPRPYLYDRKSKKLTALTVGNFGDHSQGTFPAFRSDGKILYQRVTNDPATHRTSRAWVVVDPKKLNSIEFEGTSCPATAKDASLDALTTLWSSICASEHAGEETESLNWALTVDPETCAKFVKTHYTANSAASVTVEAMVRACPSQKIAKTGLSLSTQGLKQEYPPILRRCTVCHTPDSPHGYIPFENPEAMRKMRALGNSARDGQRYFGKSFPEQLVDILDKNQETETPPDGVPRVPADGDRLRASEVREIKDWLLHGRFGHYSPITTVRIKL